MKDLYFLLIGFNEKDANVMQVLAERSFSSLQLGWVERQIATDFRLSLPNLTMAENQHDALIIDLEGVGFFGDEMDYVAIQAFISKKPVLLLTRNEIKNYQVLLQNSQSQLLQIPYNREQMMQALSDLINSCRNACERVSKSHLVDHLTKSTGDFWDNLHALQMQKESIQQLFWVVESTFQGIKTANFFDLFYRLQLLQQTSVIKLGTYQIYVNPKDKSAVCSRLERIIDHMTINSLGSHEKKLFVFELLDFHSYEEQVAVLLMDGEPKITINQLIWKMGLILVSKGSYGQFHTLQIKADFMPNLSGIEGLPSYVSPVIASCLGRSRTLSQLQTMFPLLSVSQINQVLILMIMSDVVNTQRLWLSFQTMRQDFANVNVVTNTDNHPTNVMPKESSQGVKKANSSGFLRRLLEKLGRG